MNKSSKIVLALLACLVFATAAKATDYFVSPTGTSAGNGTITKPWDLQTALYQPASVLPGDKIWVEGGTYNGTFVSRLAGTSSNPIIVRNYQGQRATLDGSGCGGIVLQVTGSYTWYWGLEVIDSADNRTDPFAPCPAFGVGVYGQGNKFIDNIVHDTGEGFSAYDEAPDTEFYGNLSYYNGFVGPSRNEGHGFYLQNSTDSKLVSDNFVGDNALEGIQIYGSGSASLVNIQSIGNILYNTSSWPTPYYQYNFIIGGGSTRSGIVVENNYTYFPPGAANGYLDLSDYTNGQDITATGNVFVGGYSPLSLSMAAGPVVFTGNTIVAGTGALRVLTLDPASGQSLSSYTWNNNTYYDLSGYHFYDGVNGSGVNMLFSSWQTQTRLDSQSTVTNAYPTRAWVYVRPNKYETNRGNIAIYNWNLAATVAVDLSSVLPVGSRYRIVDAQNYYGPPVASGTYAGGSVNIPMTGLTKAAPIGFAAPAHTAPQFGTFVVLPVGTTSTTVPPQQTDTTPPSVTISAPASGSMVSGTITLSAAASDNVGVAGVQFAIDGAALGSRITTAPYATTWNSTTVSNGSHTVTATAYDASGNNLSSTVTVFVNNAANSSSDTGGPGTSATSGSATFVLADTTTQGNWQGVYGGDGYSIPSSTHSIPTYASFTPQNGSPYTWAGTTTDTRALQLAGGSGRIASAWYSYSSFSFDVNFTDGNSHRLALYALDWDAGGRAETVQILDGATGALLDTRSISSFSNGLYLIWNIAGHVKVTVTNVSGPNAVVGGAFFDPTGSSGSTGRSTSVGSTTGITNNSAPSGTAAFLSSDASTRGSWLGVYGGDGYSVPNSTQVLPAYATFAVQNGTAYTWSSAPTDTRAPETGNGSARIASTWFNTATFSFDVNFTDGNSHQFALYALDWDSKGRAETIRIQDVNTSAVLDSRSVTNFSNGIYLVWNIAGHVKVTVTATGGPNAVISGAFFGAGSASQSGSAAKFLRTDTATQGNWKGVYGLDGYSVADATPSSIPGYATFTPQNQGIWMWASSGTETRDPELPGSNAGPVRQASCWFTYYSDTFDFDVNMTDGQAHPFELYLLDWDSKGRTETIQIVDAVSNTVLDTQKVANFTQGIYYIWNISGHVKINITGTFGPNGVASAAFFN